LKSNNHYFVLQKKKNMSSPSSSKMLPPYAKSVTQLMTQIASPPIRLCYAQIACNMYVDDELVESNDLDD